jgi:hypothetical protein
MAARFLLSPDVSNCLKKWTNRTERAWAYPEWACQYGT